MHSASPRLAGANCLPFHAAAACRAQIRLRAPRALQARLLTPCLPYCSAGLQLILDCPKLNCPKAFSQRPAAKMLSIHFAQRSIGRPQTTDVHVRASFKCSLPYYFRPEGRLNVQAADGKLPGSRQRHCRRCAASALPSGGASRRILRPAATSKRTNVSTIVQLLQGSPR